MSKFQHFTSTIGIGLVAAIVLAIHLHIQRAFYFLRMFISSAVSCGSPPSPAGEKKPILVMTQPQQAWYIAAREIYHYFVFKMAVCHYPCPDEIDVFRGPHLRMKQLVYEAFEKVFSSMNSFWEFFFLRSDDKQCWIANEWCSTW